MLFAAVIVLAALQRLPTALAYQVTRPTIGDVWSASGSNTLTWDRVVTDAHNFTAVLVNQDRSVLPVNNYLLLASVDGSLRAIHVSPPASVLPVGDGFQVNLVKSPKDVNTIYAQSQQFRIKGSTEATTLLASGTTAVDAQNGLGTVGRSTLFVPSTTSLSEPTDDSLTTNGAVTRTVQPTYIVLCAMAVVLADIYFAG